MKPRANRHRRSALQRAAAARAQCSISENQIGEVGNCRAGLVGGAYSGVVGGADGKVCGSVGIEEEDGDPSICGLVGDIDNLTGTEGTEGAVGLVGG